MIGQCKKYYCKFLLLPSDGAILDPCFFFFLIYTPFRCHFYRFSGLLRLLRGRLRGKSPLISENFFNAPVRWNDLVIFLANVCLISSIGLYRENTRYLYLNKWIGQSWSLRGSLRGMCPRGSKAKKILKLALLMKRF